MKIESLSVKNYRTLQDIQVTFKGFYTAISGKNNAGKTSVIKILREILQENDESPFMLPEESISHREDKTQWVEDSAEIELVYEIMVGRTPDPGLFVFLEKFLGNEIEEDNANLQLKLIIPPKGGQLCVATIGNTELEKYESNEILKKLKSSNLNFFHNSTGSDLRTLVSWQGRISHELLFSDEEMDQLAEEQRRVKNKVKALAKVHKAELTKLLGHLEEKYDVEFTLRESTFSRSMPFGINLKNKDVDVPLNEWGSGTRNRTKIMMSILQAKRIESQQDDENRITPIIIIEEPESFLHPSAQAEFGRVLQDLASELSIQIIVTTHSPYMLSQENPGSNILLDRRVVRRRLKGTYSVDTDNDNWMIPFSENLGLNNAEFDAWKCVLSTANNNVLLVEGDIDKRYLEHINSLKLNGLSLAEGIEIVPYGGKDALENTILLKFMLEKFDKTFITFDLDAKIELSKHMDGLGLIEGKHYFPIGVNQPGKDCIEGLVPESLLAKVYSQNPSLVAQLGSSNSKDRKDAKSLLKQKILSEFCNTNSFDNKELEGFSGLFKSICNAYK